MRYRYESEERRSHYHNVKGGLGRRLLLCTIEDLGPLATYKCIWPCNSTSLHYVRVLGVLEAYLTRTWLHASALKEGLPILIA